MSCAQKGLHRREVLTFSVCQGKPVRYKCDDVVRRALGGECANNFDDGAGLMLPPGGPGTLRPRRLATSDWGSRLGLDFLPLVGFTGNPITPRPVADRRPEAILELASYGIIALWGLSSYACDGSSARKP